MLNTITPDPSPPQDQEPPAIEGSIGSSVSSHVTDKRAFFSGISSLSTSMKQAIGYNSPLEPSGFYGSYVSSYLRFNGTQAGLESKVNSIQDQLASGTLVQSHPNSEDEIVKDEVEIKARIDPSALDSKSIVVFMSIKNTVLGSICTQSHYSNIVFYGNLDFSLDNFLREHLLNQESKCEACGELPEAHSYYYAYHNTQLTIQVIRGEAGDELSMWSCCGKCESSKPTKRVVVSTSAGRLSFGKFLESGFSQASDELSNCGHSLENDFFYFFGLGQRIAMFRYSPVTTYTISLPPEKLVFSTSTKLASLKKEFENFMTVYIKGMSLFSEISTALEKLKSQFNSSTIDLGGLQMNFSEVEEMLMEETLNFKSNIENAVKKIENPDSVLYKLLSLNRLRWELLLESCIWERRLFSLMLANQKVTEASEERHEWCWNQFNTSLQVFMDCLQNGCSAKLELISSHTVKELPTAFEFIAHEGSRVHIPLNDNSYFVSDFESELSSVIACALVFLRDVGNEDDKEEIVNGMAKVPGLNWSVSCLDTKSRVLRRKSKLGLLHRKSRLGRWTHMGYSVAAKTPKSIVTLGIEKNRFGLGKYSVISPFAEEFKDLRSRCCPSEVDYIASVSRCEFWNDQGGSRTIFAKTLDTRFIMKEINDTKFGSFLRFAKKYFDYVKNSFDNGSPTCLAKILGIYQVIVRAPTPKGGKETRRNLIVMENLSFGRNISRQYDLKGVPARFRIIDGSEEVLLDKNFVNDMNSSPIFISSKSKRLLNRAVWNDTSFLASIDIIDYSLLLGADNEQHELVCGIVDYLTPLTWDKRAEYFFKQKVIARKGVTMHPSTYKARFRKFIKAYLNSLNGFEIIH